VNSLCLQAVAEFHHGLIALRDPGRKEIGCFTPSAHEAHRCTESSS